MFTRRSSLLSATFFILFTASARAGIVASRHFLALGRFMGTLFTASQIENQLLAMHFLFHLFDLFAVMIYLNPENTLDNLFTDTGHQFHKQVIGFFLVLLLGIFLTIPAQTDPFLQVVDVQEMVFPVRVYCLKHHYLDEMVNQFLAHLFNPPGKDGMGLLAERVVEIDGSKPAYHLLRQVKLQVKAFIHTVAYPLPIPIVR